MYHLLEKCNILMLYLLEKCVFSVKNLLENVISLFLQHKTSI